MPWNRHRTRQSREQLEHAVRADMEADVRLNRAKRQGEEIEELAKWARYIRLRNHHGEDITASFAPRKKVRRWRSSN